MTVFVTGASGYIGRAVLRVLAERGEKVAALVRSDSAEQIVHELGARPVRGELSDVDVLRAAAAEADAVIHLGMVNGPEAGAVDLLAADALLTGGEGRPYVHTGGVWVYGNTDGVVDEDGPQSPPALTAWRSANEAKVLDRGAVLVRPGMVYGHSGGLIEMFLAEDARENGSVRCVGDGSHHWTMVHVDDIAELYLLALNATVGSVYTGVTQNVPMREISLAVSQNVGCAGRIRSVSADELGLFGEAFSLDQQVTSGRARSQLGWRPTHTDALRDLTSGA